MPNTTGKILEIRVCEKGDKAHLTNSALVNFAKTVCDFLIFTTEYCLAKGGFQGCGENPNSPHVILPSRRKPTSGKRSEPRRAGGALQSKDLGAFSHSKKNTILCNKKTGLNFPCLFMMIFFVLILFQ